MEHGGDTPYILSSDATDYKRLYRSDPAIAILREISLIPGCGVVPQGCVVGKVVGGTRAGYFAPYNTNPNQSGTDPVQFHGGRSYLVADTDTGASAHDLSILIDDSYMFVVGDVICVNSDGGTPYQLTITAIDRTTYRNRAIVTCSGTISVAHTVANQAHIHIDTENANTYSYARGILDKAVDTGYGVNAKGGAGTMILSNALLHFGMLMNLDTAAIADLSATEDQPFLLMK